MIFGRKGIIFSISFIRREYSGDIGLGFFVSDSLRIDEESRLVPELLVDLRLLSGRNFVEIRRRFSLVRKVRNRLDRAFEQIHEINAFIGSQMDAVLDQLRQRNRVRQRVQSLRPNLLPEPAGFQAVTRAGSCSAVVRLWHVV